jgi:hypothetical protein
MTSNATSSNNSFFDLITVGVGFINRPRVLDEKGKPLALTFVASYGNADDKNKTTFELYVRGSEAKLIIQDLVDNFDKNDTIWAKLEIGDIRPDLPTDDNGEFIRRKDGSLYLINRGNLLKVHFLKKNGEVLVHAKQAEATPETATDTSQETTEAESVQASA